MDDGRFRIIGILAVLGGLLLLALVVVGVGRSGGGPDVVETTLAVLPTTVPPGTAAPTTTAPPPNPSTTAAATPTTAACPSPPPLDPGAEEVTTLAVDVDADGAPDDLTTYRDPATGRWHVRLGLAAGGGGDRVVEDADPATGSRPLGGHDLDGDGRLEVFVVVGSGASAELVGLFTISGCELVRITVDGSPSIFPVGASVAHGEGLSCNGVGDLDVWSVETADGTTWSGSRVPYRLAGTELVAGPVETVTLGMEEAVARVGIDCSGIAGP